MRNYDEFEAKLSEILNEPLQIDFDAINRVSGTDKLTAVIRETTKSTLLIALREYHKFLEQDSQK